MSIRILAVLVAILILGGGAMTYLNNEGSFNTGDQVYSPDLPDLKDEFDSTATAYQITDTTGLVNLSSLANAGNTFEGKTIFLANDLDLSGIEFVPINSFSGTFDGQEYEISKLTITSSGYNVGFINVIQSAGIVKNVGFVDTNINTNSTGTNLRLGTIAGTNIGTIQNCYNTGDVRGSSKENSMTIGGIVGNNNGTIQNCYNTGSVTVANTSTYKYVGGIAGYNEKTITNSYNTGSVSGTNIEYYTHAGGIAGENGGSNRTALIQNCYNTGSVITNNHRYGYSGGIAGQNSLIISNCYNTGDVTATNTVYVGGIAPRYNVDTVTNCYKLQTDSNAGTTVTSDELKSPEILTALGSAYTADTSLINNGYPVLTWQITSYTISFDSQGGSTVEPITINEGQVAIKPDNPTKDEKVFWYWALNDIEFDFSTAINSDLTLTAVWYDKLFFTSTPGGST